MLNLNVTFNLFEVLPWWAALLICITIITIVAILVWYFKKKTDNFKNKAEEVELKSLWTRMQELRQKQKNKKKATSIPEKRITNQEKIKKLEAELEELKNKNNNKNNN